MLIKNHDDDDDDDDDGYSLDLKFFENLQMNILSSALW